MEVVCKAYIARLTRDLHRKLLIPPHTSFLREFQRVHWAELGSLATTLLQDLLCLFISELVFESLFVSKGDGTI